MYEVERWGLCSVPPPCCLMQRAAQAVNHYTTRKKREWYLERDLKSRALCLHLVFKTTSNADNKALSGISCRYHKQSLSCQDTLVPGSRQCDSLPSAWWKWGHQNSVASQSFIWRFTQFSSSFFFTGLKIFSAGWLARNHLSGIHMGFHIFQEFSIPWWTFEIQLWDFTK